MSSTAQDRLVWIDCEMTGLDLSFDELCEIAVYVTDYDLNLLDEEGLDLVIKPSDRALEHMNEFVTNMHTESGLIEEIPQGISVADAQQQVLAYVQRFVDEPRKAPLAGNTIGTDRSFLLRFMPELDEYLHYRSIDVSTFKELARHWYPRAYFNSPEKHGGHRAAADIVESIRELHYYRATMCAPAPGPTSAEAKDAAERSVADFAKYLDH